MPEGGRYKMIIKFSMDQITNIGVLYTWTHAYSNESDSNVTEEHYDGDTYCKQIVADTLTVLKWGTQTYLGSSERIANETFDICTDEGIKYHIEFGINTYERKAARLECTITAPETEGYDQKLEELKIALKNRLIRTGKFVPG